MNEKFQMTGEEYRHRVRKQAKARTNKFRAEQEKRGYKNLTVYLSEPFRAELEKLSKDKGFNRQAAMDHIFGIYQGIIKGNVTSNVTARNNKGTERPVNIEPSKKREKKAENQAEKIEGPEQDIEIPVDNESAVLELEIELDGSEDMDSQTDESEIVIDGLILEPEPEPTDKQISETEPSLFDDGPDAVEPKPEKKQSTGEKPFDKAEICKIVVDLRDSQGMSYQIIAKELKKMGYSPKTKGKDTFHHSTIANYYNESK